jgi:hypothetical protein
MHAASRRLFYSYNLRAACSLKRAALYKGKHDKVGLSISKWKLGVRTFAVDNFRQHVKFVLHRLYNNQIYFCFILH